MPRVRWRAAQGVRIDRRDLQRVGLLPDRLARRREEGIRLVVVVGIQLVGFDLERFVEWRVILRFGIIEV
jgi:hypothetical protein